MRHRLSDHAGGLVIDHTNSPGLTEADIATMRPGAVAVGEGQKLEIEIWQCTHCQAGVLLNPLRVRPRATCLKCYHYICDSCDAIMRATGLCKPFAAVLDQVEAIANKFAGQPDHPEAALDEARLTLMRQEPAAPRIVLTDISHHTPREQP